MAASVYATPPPDLSGEDTALSDVSNSSSSSSSQTKSIKRSLSSTLLANQNSSNPFDLMHMDQSKKRRKQTTPIRISALNLSTDNTNKIEECDKILANNQNLFLPNKTQLYTKELSNEINSNISPLIGFNSSTKVNIEMEENHNKNLQQPQQAQQQQQQLMNECEHCGATFSTIMLLKIHILQQHATSNSDDIKHTNNLENLNDKIKIEQDKSNSPSDENRIPTNPPRTDEWMNMHGINFPFPPEAAAAALSASSYLSQLPLLGIPTVSSFSNIDGLSRPPLRIFNPEAYCGLCNKEFCNKYFLKTHKANKHGIYDPTVSANDTNPLNQITQALQMQLQQQQQQQLPQTQLQPILQSQSQSQQQQQQQQLQTEQQSQVQQQVPSQQVPSSLLPPEPAIYCDICHKRFTNIFAMKRHRSKTHEIPPPNSPHQPKLETNDSNDSSEKENPLTVRIPENFREDFSIEQEDVLFTPQPRKLSPVSSQQAQEANFSYEKLKHLGVLNPEAFCNLCCKEYCNKYFLRTHKIKRHGIQMPDDCINDKNQFNYIQTMPLNLMQRKSCDSDDSDKFSNKDLEKSIEKKYENNNSDLERISEINENIHPIPPDVILQERDPDAISIDLQKLQSMILQLNDLNNQRQICCHICGKEFENQYILHAHMTSEHTNDSSLIENNITKNLSPSRNIIQGEICKQCDKEFTSLNDLKQHIYEIHSIQLNSPIREGFITPERPVSTNTNIPLLQGQGERRQPYTITPTSSYCEICNKELCNKYFMKTHMQRMHGIEIENGAQIGGVVCNICNKELCSKYFLRVHKHNTHGIIEEGSPLPQSRQNGDPIDSDSISAIDVSIKGDLNDINSRYFTHYTEVCPLCCRRFRSSKWLKAHLLSDHGKMGSDKLREIEQQISFSKPSSPTLKVPNGGLGIQNIDTNLITKGTFPNIFMSDDTNNIVPRIKEYQCSLCSFSTPYYAFLFIHERSHTILNNTTQQPIKSELAVSIANKDQQRLLQPIISTTSSTCGTPTTTPASTPIPQIPQENAGSNKKDQINTLNELANLTNRPATYALPQNSENEIMQSFLIEQQISGYDVIENNGDNNKTISKGNNRFIPAIVFLPVKERITSPVTVSFTLSPA